MNEFMIKAVNKVVRSLLKGFHITPVGYCPSWRKLNIYDDPKFVAFSSNESVRANSLLEIDRLYSIYQALLWISSVKKDGFHSMEVGVYKGGGSYFIAHCLASISHKFSGHYSIDTFEGHKAADLPNQKEGKHSVSMFSDTAFEKVNSLLSPLKNSKVIASRIQDVEMDYSCLAFVHLDTDLYGPTKYVIEKMINEATAPYAIIVDDYGFETCPGVKIAVDECFAIGKQGVFGAALTTGQYLIVATG